MKLRLPCACQPGCALCADALELDADELPAAALNAKLEHAQHTSQQRVYLQGVEVASSPHLAAIVRFAKLRALQVALVEDGPGAGLLAKAHALKQLGIALVYLSLYSGSAADSPDATMSSPQARKQWLAVLLALSRAGGVAVGVHLPLTRRNAQELPAVLRLQARLSVRELLVSEVFAAHRAPELDAEVALAALERVWLATNAAQVRLRCLGFGRTRYVNPPIRDPAPACDSALIELIRQGIPFASARAGIHALSGPDHVSDLKSLVTSAEGLRALGIELAGRRSPFVDLPPCLGGTQVSRPLTAPGPSSTFIKSDACDSCVFDEQCAGASEQLDRSLTSPLRSALRPLPAWYSFQRPPRVLILSSLGGDPLYYISTLPALGDALRRQGATVEVVSPWLPRWSPEALPSLSHEGCAGEWMGTRDAEAWLSTHDIGGFDLVITSDFPTARVALAAPSLRKATRVVVTDFHMLERMDLALAAWLAPGARAAEGGWWPSEQLILESGFPGYIELYRNYGVPLEQIAWRPYSLCPTHFPSGPDVGACDTIFSGGNHLRDLETLRAATERLPAAVHRVGLYAPGDRFAGNAHLQHCGHVPIPSFVQALTNSRFVVLPLVEDATRAAGITVLAMAVLAGRPIVATSTAAVRDYVQHGAEALLVPPGDPLALADAITQLDTDPGLLATLAAGARNAGRRMSTEHWAEQIIGGGPLTPQWTPLGWRNW